MKTNLLFVIMLISALTASAQFNKGRLIATGEFNFMSQTNKSKSGSTTTKNYKYTNVGFTPAVGYFFMDNMAGGLAINLSTGKTKAEGSDEVSTNSTFTIGPFVRYYLPAGLFFQGAAAFGSGKSHIDFTAPTPDIDSKRGVMTWDLGAGYAYFLNDYVALEPMVGYQSTTYSDKDTDNKSIFSGMYLQAALTVYLGERN